MNIRKVRQMYRLKVRIGDCWRSGHREYETYEDAEKRVNELKAAGIEAVIVHSDDLFK